ncbi:MAG TPA: hypothetical protein VNA25_20250 [Phycisphaerae bacterium]|nr:hypothetical protein [Phycisphaerae bacterium]
MLPEPEGLVSWLTYQDIVPQRGPRVLVQGTGEEDTGEPEQVGWLNYGWNMECGLVALRKKEPALDAETRGQFDFDTGWYERKFNFGERVREDGYDLEPFVYQYKHPLKNALIVDLRQDFVRYHKLNRPQPEVYVHLGEGLEVAWIQFPGHPDQLARVEVHLDFLRDYLAARRRAMLLRFVADRFANLHDVGHLDLRAFPKVRVGRGDFRQTDIYQENGGRFWRVRSTLWKAFLIEPYPKPKVERNPWHIRLDDPNPTSHQFYLDQQGNMGTLTPEACPLYLHFRREVLRRYLESDGFRVGFHMRKWGIAANPHGNGVDVGINTEGQVTAFALDILRLPEPEHAYWASYSCFPSGVVCRELFQTRMQCDPPHSPNVVELVRDAKDSLKAIVFALVGDNLYREAGPAERDLCALTVGPLSEDLAEVIRLGKFLYQMAVEPMRESAIRKAVPNAQPPNGQAWKSIRYLQELVGQVSGCEPDEAAATVEPLKRLNELRQADAHLRDTSLQEVCSDYGVAHPPRTLCDLWDAVVDQTVACLHAVATILSSKTGGATAARCDGCCIKPQEQPP